MRHGPGSPFWAPRNTLQRPSSSFCTASTRLQARQQLAEEQAGQRLLHCQLGARHARGLHGMGDAAAGWQQAAALHSADCRA